MNILSMIKNLVNTRDNQQDSNNCTVEVILKKLKFDILTTMFDNGQIGYRDIGKYLFKNNMSQMNKMIFDPLKQKAEDGCKFKDTYIRFYDYKKKYYIEYPLEALVVKNKIPNIHKFKSEKWYKKSIYNIDKFIENKHFQ